MTSIELSTKRYDTAGNELFNDHSLVECDPHVRQLPLPLPTKKYYFLKLQHDLFILNVERRRTSSQFNLSTLS
jgi:hypothetical protein